jgi:thiamine biosynthesis lipoprotein
MVIKNRSFTKVSINIFYLALIVLSSLSFSSCIKNQQSQMEFALGTVCEVSLYEGGNKQIYSGIFRRLREIDRTMTAFPPIDDTGPLFSGVAAINDRAGIEPVEIGADLIEVLETALYYAELSNGAFDPTIGPLVRLWGIGTEAQRVPSNEEISTALELVNWRDLSVNREAGTAFLRHRGMSLDLGAIAKGYAGDEATRIAREGKVQRAIMNLGGNIVVLGWREKGRTAKGFFLKTKNESIPWRVGVQNPMDYRGAYIGILPVHDTSIVTSGVYERFFESEGNHYHHLLSTTTGYPVENGLLSVTIVTERSIIADALSTVVFTLGYQRGKTLIDEIPNTEAIFIFDDRSVRITRGLDRIFSLTDDTFTMLP